jgi:hypothetical protein
MPSAEPKLDLFTEEDMNEARELLRRRKTDEDLRSPAMKKAIEEFANKTWGKYTDNAWQQAQQDLHRPSALSVSGIDHG